MKMGTKTKVFDELKSRHDRDMIGDTVTDGETCSVLLMLKIEQKIKSCLYVMKCLSVSGVLNILK